MAPYFQDLRLRVVEAIRRGDGWVRQLARRFLAGLDPRRLVFVDECGADAALTRT